MKHCAKTVGLARSGPCLRFGIEGLGTPPWLLRLARGRSRPATARAQGMIWIQVTALDPRSLIDPFAALRCAPSRPVAWQAPGAR